MIYIHLLIHGRYYIQYKPRLSRSLKTSVTHTAVNVSIKNHWEKPSKHFARLSGSYSLEAHPNGQPVALPTLTGLRDAHAQTAF